jgi:hypothetical protein
MLSFKTHVLKVTYLLRRVKLHNKFQELKLLIKSRAKNWLHSQCVFLALVPLCASMCLKLTLQRPVVSLQYLPPQLTLTIQKIMPTKRSQVFHNFTIKLHFSSKKLTDWFFVNITLHFYYSSVAAVVVSAVFTKLFHCFSCYCYSSSFYTANCGSPQFVFFRMTL